MGQGAGEDNHDCLVAQIFFARMRTMYLLQRPEFAVSSVCGSYRAVVVVFLVLCSK